MNPFTVMAEVSEDLERTILSGWPHDTYPDDDQARAIESAFDELTLHEPTMTTARRWYLAGQIVARITRDGN